MQDRETAPATTSAAAPASEAAGAEAAAPAGGGFAGGPIPGVAPATAASAGPSASERAYEGSARFDEPIGGHGGHHHIEMIAVHGTVALRDAHGHPLVDAAGKPIHLHGKAAVQAMNAPLGGGKTGLYYVWGHMCHPEVHASGYVHEKDLAHPPKLSRAGKQDVAHVGKPAPLGDEHFVAAPKELPEDFAFKKNPAHGTFADYGEGGRAHSEQAKVGGAHRGVMYMTWNVPDHHAGAGAGITHAMLTAGDKVTRCKVEPRTMKSVDAPGTAVWWYVHAELHGSSVFGWVLAEADVGGAKIRQLEPG